MIQGLGYHLIAIPAKAWGEYIYHSIMNPQSPPIQALEGDGGDDNTISILE